MLWLFKKYNEKNQRNEEDKKVRSKRKNDDVDHKSEEEKIKTEEEINNEQTCIPQKITGRLKKKLVDKSYYPVNEEFIKEARKVIKQVNKKKSI